MSGGFEALGLIPELLKSVADLGWALPTDVQDESIPLILGGGDVMVASETGSGKTAAFCLPILQCVHERLRELGSDAPENLTGPFEVKISCIARDEAFSVTEDGIGCSMKMDKEWGGARASYGVKSGKYYYEAVVHGSGLCRFGWSTTSAQLELGKDGHGFGYGGTGMKSNDGTFAQYGEKFKDSDTIGCYLDLEKKTISYSKNGKHLGEAFVIPESVVGSVYFPAVALQDCSSTLNFGGAKPFVTDITSTEYLSLVNAASEDIVFESSKKAFKVIGKRLPLAVIIEPVGVLAEQVYNNLLDMSKYLAEPSLKILHISSGDNSLSHKLEAGVDIVVGSVGKVSSLAKQGILDLSQIRFFVLDEADALASGNFLSEVKTLFHKCPKIGSGDNRLQVCFFSATLHSPEITYLASAICHRPAWVDLKGMSLVPASVHHVVYRVDPATDLHLLVAAEQDGLAHYKSSIDNTDAHVDKKARKEEGKGKGKGGGKEEKEKQGMGEGGKEGEGGGVEELALKGDVVSVRVKEIKLIVLLRILQKHKIEKGIIFCRTNRDCTYVEKFLNSIKKDGKSANGGLYSNAVVGGAKTTAVLKENLESFRNGEVRFLICTDMAARGVDVEGIPVVINMTLPITPQEYIHRVGRVGRAGTAGLAISLVAAEGVREKVWYHECKNPKSCLNGRLKADGGCAIYLDESDNLRAVEELLEEPVQAMEKSFELPDRVKNAGVEWGKAIKQEEEIVSVFREDLGSYLEELKKMENKAQNNFLLMEFNLLAQS